MQVVLVFVPLLIMLSLCAVYAKLAARILQKSQLSWGNSFLFALILAALAIAGSTVSYATGYSLPLAASLAVGLTMNLLLGGWFFGTRASDAQGQLFGWRRGMALSGILFALLAITAAVLLSFVTIHFSIA